MGIGENIKAFRVANKMTQGQLAEKAGISRVALGNYEREERTPNLEIINKISLALGVSSDIVINFKELTVDALHDLKVINRISIPLSKHYIRSIEDIIKSNTLKIKDNIDVAQAYATRGFFYTLLDMYDEAINDYSKAIELNARIINIIFYLRRGNIYSLMGLKEKAFEDYNKFIKYFFNINDLLDSKYELPTKGLEFNDIEKIVTESGKFSYVQRSTNFTENKNSQSNHSLKIHPVKNTLHNKINLLNDDCLDLISNLVDKLIQDKNNLK